MKICPYCKAENKEGDVNCGKCLKSLECKLADEKVLLGQGPAWRAYWIDWLLGVLSLIVLIGVVFFVEVIVRKLSWCYTITNKRIITKKHYFKKEKHAIDL